MGKKQIEADELSLAVAAILEEARQESGMSYRTLEDKADIPRMRGTRALKGERPFIIDDIESISDALGLVAWRVVRDAEESIAGPRLSIIDDVSEHVASLDQDDYMAAANNPGVDIQAEQEGMMEET